MGLGVFVSSKGDATRAFQYPYILALMDDNALAIHNILDQRLIQNIYIPKEIQQPIRIANARLVFNNNDQQNDAKNLNIKVLLYSCSKLYALTMKPIDFQLKEMMNEKYVNYALFLLEHNILKEEYYVEVKEAKLRQFYRNAGYVLMKETLFDDALEYFIKGSNYKNIDETTKDSFSQAFYENAKNMLTKYLKFSRKNQISSGKKQEIDTTLLKLYVENNDNKLYEMIKEENHCNIEESIEILKEKNKYYAVGLLYESKGLFQKALDIWIKIESKQLRDPDFPGIQYIVDFLSNVEDKELVWKYSKWVLNEDQKLGAKIFMSEKHNDLDPSNVVFYLEKHWNEASLIYLEHLINDMKTESFEHEKALKILLYQLNDYNGAEEYCHENQKKWEEQKIYIKTPKTSNFDINENNNQIIKNSPNLSNLFLNTVQKKKESLYLTLLRLYMKMENRDLLAPKIIKVLNTSYQELSLKEVLDIIPLHWSLSILNTFLSRSLRNSVHIEQQTKIVTNIVKGENTNVKNILIKYLDKNPPLIIDDNTKCSLCDNEILEENFVKTSDGKIVHFNCYNKNNK
ncbi:hypothetical protein PIROE2DRAFT_57124 [Piromyces sp. E2]|nr:hypothetical protein PIROE2DRAFT_57124 [Piromyces sp. E2]|eukprot:OUM69866.1 hypothetical protein PIROE2DRAFT_57124 [Piromyces sp. E2]